ncbi:MAG: NTP transferase domain-containing protein [Bacteroidetes bacterium]|nr:NTP transferase domain-containing protein [Bacteroidota bacterium]
MQTRKSDENQRPLAVVIMAAGKGTRMKDPSKAKVMYEVLGKPMIHYVVDLAMMLNASRVISIVGYQRDAVIQYLQKSHPNVEIAVQAEQLGTGHAIIQTKTTLENFDGDVAILSGDVPLLTVGSMHRLIEHHFKTEASATILTAEFQDPTGYGRIMRNEDGSVKKIVEHKDATDEERFVKEINSGIYIFNRQKLFDALQHITPQNAQNEYYLTDVFGHFWAQRWKVSALKINQLEEIMGVNTVQQLEEVKQVLLTRKQN